MVLVVWASSFLSRYLEPGEKDQENTVLNYYQIEDLAPMVLARAELTYMYLHIVLARQHNYS